MYMGPQARHAMGEGGVGEAKAHGVPTEDYL